MAADPRRRRQRRQIAQELAAAAAATTPPVTSWIRRHPADNGVYVRVLITANSADPRWPRCAGPFWGQGGSVHYVPVGARPGRRRTDGLAALLAARFGVLAITPTAWPRAPALVQNTTGPRPSQDQRHGVGQRRASALPCSAPASTGTTAARRTPMASPGWCGRSTSWRSARASLKGAGFEGGSQRAGHGLMTASADYRPTAHTGGTGPAHQHLA